MAARAHAMPFGAELVAGGVRFALWAPGASEVAVAVEREGGPALPMEARSDGWFVLETSEGGAGTAYRFRIDGGPALPDPASRFQPEGVHGPSRVVDPAAYEWRATEWRGRPWEEAVLYELHVGTFSPAGNYRGVRDRLDHLVDLGVTAVELMPVAAFSGTRGWGYDGVLPYAPYAPYGSPDELKALVDAAHARGLQVLLDVVYNHFGPDGNYLHLYAPGFFTDRFHTPWGAAIDFARRPVRDFFIHNALYWLEEFRFDGLRLDAVHAIHDARSPHVLDELAERVAAGPGADRHVHLALENVKNEARFLGTGAGHGYRAQWNDDIHHALHVTATGEQDGYYGSYADDPVGHLGRCLAEGFAYQGEPFPYWEGRERGEPSARLPPGAFVSFLQNHDQVGNRALGERLELLADARAIEALLAVLLLAPCPPMLFMGEEWGARTPFLYFCDFHDELADLVREGRRREFARFPAFRDEAARERIPDPGAPETFERSRLRWEEAEREEGAARLALCRKLLRLRHAEIVPRLPGMSGRAGRYERFGSAGLLVRWTLGDGSTLQMAANLSPEPCREAPERPEGRLLYRTPGGPAAESASESEAPRRPAPMPPWSVEWVLR